MIHTSPNGFESELIRSAITSTVVTATATATTATNASHNSNSGTATTTTTTTAPGSAVTTTDSTLMSPTELRLKNRLQRIIRIPPSVAQTHSKATASTSTSPTTATSTTTTTITTPPNRSSSNLVRVEKRRLVGVTLGQDKPASPISAGFRFIARFIVRKRQ
ncbi:hypothetical protein BGX23_010639 [Mortierella sp. AD031]|nr:hypothetical protein BGX23_010639 [Mortierella sp. AD031]